jgi:hypothetical protein
LQSHVADVGEESSVIADVGHELARIICMQGLNGSTTFTDKMDVGLFIADRVEGRRTMADVRMRDEADLLKDIEDSVHRGQRHTRCNALDRVENFLRCPVPEAIDSLEHELTLRSDSIAVNFEHFIPASGQVSHVISPVPAA